MVQHYEESVSSEQVTFNPTRFFPRKNSRPSKNTDQKDSVTKANHSQDWLVLTVLPFQV